MFTRRMLALAAAAAIVALGVGDARANGRFPASSAMIFSPGDDARVIVRTTFGLVVSGDGGASWRWICERAIGFSGPEDPSYVVTRSGAIVAGLFDGLRVSRDGGCSWSPVKTDASVFVDVTSRADGAVVALASSYDRYRDGGSTYKTQLWVSTDDARTFVPLGPRFDPTLLGETVEVAPSDPSRVYVSAVRGDGATRTGVILVSTDGGATWVERRSVLEAKELAPFIAAVDPKRADRIYVRTSAQPEAPTRLLVSDDAAKSFRSLLGAKGPLLGFALSADGARVSAGGPDDGLYAGSVGDAALAHVVGPPPRIQCLGLRGDVLWACSGEASGVHRRHLAERWSLVRGAAPPARHRRPARLSGRLERREGVRARLDEAEGRARRRSESGRQRARRSCRGCRRCISRRAGADARSRRGVGGRPRRARRRCGTPSRAQAQEVRRGARIRSRGSCRRGGGTS